MIREELSRALQVLGDRLPGGEIVLLVRRPYGDHGVSFLAGDVEGVTGHPREAFEGSTEEWVEAVVHPADRSTVRERLRSLPDPEALRLEYRVTDPSGGVRWLREQLRVLRRDPGDPPEVVGLLSDATFERTIQQKVSRLEDELWSARKLESVGTIASSVAHDFNNLLTVVLTSTDLLRQLEDLPEESIEDVRMIRDAATRGKALVRQILAFGSRGPKRVENVPLCDLVEDLAPILRRVGGERIHFTLETPDEGWPVEVDRAHVEQILLNLVTNACEAMPAGGELRVRVEHEEVRDPAELDEGSLEPGRYVRVTVRDSGPGIDPEVRDRLFDPFVSTRRDEDREGGGFGLSTVRRLVRGYGGGVGIESEVGRGTAFHVYFPVRDVEHPGMPSPETMRGAVDPPESGCARILVVEDDPAVRRLVERILSGVGHSVAVAGNAAEGLQVFDRVRPRFDLLVTDVVLPDRSGHDLWRAASRRVRDLPVLYMSGYDHETVAREGVSDPGERLLRKPVSRAQLLDAVDRALELAGRTPDADELPEAGQSGA